MARHRRRCRGRVGDRGRDRAATLDRHAADPHFGTTPFLTLETGRVYLRLRPLLTGRVEFGDITLQRPRIALIQNAEGRLNVASLAPPADSKATPRPGRSGGGAAGGAAAAI